MKKLFVLLLLLAGMSFGQVTVAPFTTPQIQFFTANGLPCSGCLLSTFAAGTSTPLATYSDSLGTVLNTNPIVLGSDGVAIIYLTSASYKFVLKTAASVPIRTVDNVTWASPLSTFNGITSTGNIIAQPATAATGGANQSSPTLCIDGFYFSVTSLTDQWCLQTVLGSGANPSTTFNVTHSGSGGAATANLPFAVQLNSIQSRTASPATSGVVQLATGDTACWRNAANGANVCLSDPGIAAQGTGNLADLLKWNGSGYQGGAFVDTSANPAASGVLRVANNVVAVAARNGAGNSDVALLQADTQNNAFIPAPIRQTEIAAPTGILGSDLLWADSTAHRWKMVNNNGVLDPVVGQATIDTLTNKTLTAPAISDPTITGNTNLKRIKANQGTAIVTGDVGSLGAGWGTTASVASVSGNDVIGQINILSNGTGQGINALFTLTFHDGTWTTAPLCLVVRSDGNAPNGAFVPNAMTATSAAFFFNAVPVAGTTYTATFICVGR